LLKVALNTINQQTNHLILNVASSWYIWIIGNFLTIKQQPLTHI
jgi:hypothetical protein